MEFKFLVGKILLLKNKILIVGDAVVNDETFELIEKYFYVVRVKPVTLKSKLSRENNFKAIWIHLDTYIDESLLGIIKEIPYLISTTTGLTHISREAQEYYGSNLICLKNRDRLLNQVTTTAEHTWMLIMNWNNHVEKSFESVTNGYWARNNFFRKSQLSTKTLGVIGFGRLGKMVASYGFAFKMKILIYDIDKATMLGAADLGYEVSNSISEIFLKSDIISIHANYGQKSPPIITKEILDLASKPMLIVNTARGGLVDEEALIQRIKQNPQLFYSADVLMFEDEGGKLQDSKLWKYSLTEKRVKISPHIGGANLEAAFLCERELLKVLLDKLNYHSKEKLN
jgi:D-3-phosphoglycerate dehydrogenase